MDLTPMLRQAIQWTPRLSSGTRGEAAYGPTQVVAGRKVPKYRDIITPAGETVTTSSLVTLLVQPGIGDQLDGREVIQVDGMVDYTGAAVGWQALTR